MTNYEYYKANAIKKLQSDLETYEAEIEILQQVKRVYKKDWTDFQSYLKNFDCWDKVNMYFEFDDSIKLCSWISWKCQSVSLWYIKSHKDFVEEIRKIQPERIIKSDWKIDRVKLTPSEFMDEVKDWIERRQKRVEFIKNTLKNSDWLFKDLIEKLGAVNQILETTADWDNRSVYRTIRDFCKWCID